MVPVFFVLGMFLAIAVWVTLQARADAQRAQASLTKVARRLDLALDGRRASGVIDVPVEIELREDFSVQVQARMKPALGLGLRIARRRGISLRPDHRLHPAFDSAYVLESTDRVQAVELVSGKISRILVQADATGDAASIDDDRVRFTLPRLPGADHIASAAREANDIAVLLMSRRPLVTTSAVERSAYRALLQVGKEVGAEVNLRAGRLELVTSDGRLSVQLERQSTVFDFQLMRRLPCELGLTDERERGEIDRMLHPDIQTGEALFDAAFVVRGSPEDKVKKVLDVPSRGALLTLRRRVRELDVSEHGIHASVSLTLDDPKKLSAIVEALLRAAEALGSHSQPRAYR